MVPAMVARTVAVGDRQAIERCFDQFAVLRERAVPLQRESLPHSEARNIEAEDRQDRQGQVQEGVRGDRVDSQRSFHSSASPVRRTANSSTSARAIKANDAAAPKGQSRALVN